VILGGGVAVCVCLLLSAHRAVIFAIHSFLVFYIIIIIAAHLYCSYAQTHLALSERRQQCSMFMSTQFAVGSSRQQSLITALLQQATVCNAFSIFIVRESDFTHLVRQHYIPA